MVRKKRPNSYRKPKIAIEHTGFYPYLQRFLEDRLVKGFSEETDKRQDSHLRQLIAWCDERSLTDPREVTKPILERYQRHLHHYRKANDAPLSLSSQITALTAIRAWFRWLSKENHLLYNPASELELPKRSNKLPRAVLSESDVFSILNQPDITTPGGIRDRTFLDLLYSCGIRRKELSELKLHNVDVSQELLMVREGKGGKDRYLPIGARATGWLDKYLTDVRDFLLLDNQEDHLFINDYGAPYSHSSLGQVVKKYILKAGLEVTGSCHLFRHAMATTCLIGALIFALFKLF
jgi:integrase/recombinase XerD